MTPDKAVPLGEILQHFEERVYRDPWEIEQEAGRIWGRTGFPGEDQVEEASGRGLATTGWADF